MTGLMPMREPTEASARRHQYREAGAEVIFRGGWACCVPPRRWLVRARWGTTG